MTGSDAAEVPVPPVPAAPADRTALRRRLIEERRAWASGPGFDGARAALVRHLLGVLLPMEPRCLGLYWPTRSEFNAAQALQEDPQAAAFLQALALALPFAHKAPPSMHYRRWDGRPPAAHDDCGIPASTGAPAEPDVVLVPCVGYTRRGFRLGYGGGYFDRWLAAHPGVVAIGVAGAFAELDDADFAAQPHDRPLDLVVTERGVLAPDWTAASAPAPAPAARPSPHG